MKAKYIAGYLMLGLLGITTTVSCNDYLDKEPEDQIIPEKYFTQEADLAAYSINLYNFTTVGVGSYGISVFSNDNATDNQAARTASTRWEPGQWQVGSSSSNGDGGVWDWSQVRHCNYFFDQVLPKYEAGSISGDPANIKHYIGEMYVLRAYAYFDKLSSIGDCPIFTTALPDDKETLMKYSVRQPRNKVARFILEDLDKAIELLKDESPSGKVRISKNVAHLLRSRVALFEGTWEKYHAGTAFVPGGKGWPGKAEDAADYNNATEVSFFLSEAAKSAQVVADQVVGQLAENTDTEEGMDASLTSLNPYYTMFCDENMESYPEVIMWRQFDREAGVTHNIQMQLERNGGGTGYTRGLVNSFLMENGLPIYAAGSGYDTEWEKQGVKATLQKRDSRIRIFTKQDGDVDYYAANGTPVLATEDWLFKGDSETRMVTGFALKKGKHYSNEMQLYHGYGTSGSVVFRGAEALLNYIEASYELNGSIDSKADEYWKALRRRAKVSEDYQATINATDMAQEAKGDFGAYSHGQLIDATLYNIRRERRNELIAEGMRWDDLRRWRSCDQVNGYQIEGMRYWGSVYADPNSSFFLKDDAGNNLCKVDVDGEKGNMSDETISGVYVRPYQITRVNNLVFDGYKFTPAHYLSPIPQSVFRKTASNESDLSTSVVYQNPGWQRVAGTTPSTVE